MDDDLVQESLLQTLAGDVRAEDDNIAAIGSLLRDGHGLLDADVHETPGNALDDWRDGPADRGATRRTVPGRRRRRTRLQAILHVLRSPADQEGPVEETTLSTVSRDPASVPKAQLMSSFGPAMKPSRLIIVCQSSCPSHSCSDAIHPF